MTGVSCVMITDVWRPSSQHPPLARRLRGRAHCAQGDWHRPVWIHEMVDQRAHAVFEPFVTWSTNPQYLIPPGRPSGRSASFGEGDGELGPAGLCWTRKKERLQDVCCPRASRQTRTCFHEDLLEGFLDGRPSTLREGACRLHPPKCSSDQLTRVRSLYLRPRSLGPAHLSVQGRPWEEDLWGSQPRLGAPEKGSLWGVKQKCDRSCGQHLSGVTTLWP